MYIKSQSNSIIKHINSLKKRSYREEFSEVLLEGMRLVSDSCKNGAEISMVFIREGYEGEIPNSEKVYTLSRDVFDKIAETQTPQGIMAIAKTKTYTLEDLNEGNLVIVCDNLRDPGNLGTIIRTAHALNAAGVVLTKGCVDLYNSKTIRSTMGSAFALKVALVDDINDLKKLQNNGFKFAAGTLADDSVSLYEADLQGKWAVVIGNEGFGICKEIAYMSDIKVLIPMPGGAESLNASVACALMAYEHFRQNNKEELK